VLSHPTAIVACAVRRRRLSLLFAIQCIAVLVEGWYGARFLATIKHQKARELIYETVLEVVLADVPMREETALLKRRSRLWRIKAHVVRSRK